MIRKSKEEEMKNNYKISNGNEKKLRIILCGFGVVGQSLVKLFDSRSEDLVCKIWIKAKSSGSF